MAIAGPTIPHTYGERDERRLAVSVALSLLLHLCLLLLNPTLPALRYAPPEARAIEAHLVSAPRTATAIAEPTTASSNLPPLRVVTMADESPVLPRAIANLHAPDTHIIPMTDSATPDHTSDVDPAPIAPFEADRDASISPEDRHSLSELISGVGTIRLILTIAPAGNVEEVSVQTTGVPPDIEREVTRRVYAVPFLPAVRLGNTTRSQFILELEP